MAILFATMAKNDQAIPNVTSPARISPFYTKQGKILFLFLVCWGVCMLGESIRSMPSLHDFTVASSRQRDFKNELAAASHSSLPLPWCNREQIRNVQWLYRKRLSSINRTSNQFIRLTLGLLFVSFVLQVGTSHHYLTNDLKASIAGEPRITHLTLTNYTSDQAFDPILARVMDKESVYEHLDYYGLNKSQPLIFFITPTYRRTSQMVDLVRLGQTLHMDPGIYWIVVEDAENCSKRVRDLVERMGLPYAHMAVPTAKALQQKLRPHRGVDQRNRALEVVDSIGIPGVVYFGDDDNAYDGERNRAS
jgi:hypothetical protein